MTTALLFAGAAWRTGFDWYLPAVLAFLGGLLALAIIDLDELILPTSIVYTTLAMVAALLVVDAAVTGSWHRLVIAVSAAFGWFALFFIINLVSPRVLGFGDVRLAPVLGLGLGWLGVGHVILGFFAANFVGAAIGLTLIATRRMSRDQPVPYGVFLAIGSALAVFAGPEILAPLHISG